MKSFKTVQTTKEDLTEITCDNCGVISKGSKNGLHPGMDPYIDTIPIYWGYGSKYDQELWEIDLCESCIEKILGSIKHQVFTPGDEDLAEYDGLI